jgi:hypothetical protein
MNEIKNKMIKLAVERYKDIYPCSDKENLGECFTTEGSTIIFWFNTADESTHVLTSISQ